MIDEYKAAKVPASQVFAQSFNKDDILARDVSIMGIFSDWPATVTYYASCMGLK